MLECGPYHLYFTMLRMFILLLYLCSMLLIYDFYLPWFLKRIIWYFDSETTVKAIEDTFKDYTTREDIAIILISQYVSYCYRFQFKTHIAWSRYYSLNAMLLRIMESHLLSCSETVIKKEFDSGLLNYKPSYVLVFYHSGMHCYFQVYSKAVIISASYLFHFIRLQTW